MCIGGCSKMNGMGTINGSLGCKGCGRGHSAEDFRPVCTIFALTGSKGFESYHVAEMVGTTLGIPQVVPYTTRPRHMNEVDGQHACFVNETDFSEAEDRNEFLLVSVYEGHRYGIKTEDIDRMIHTERPVCLRTDLEGAMKLKARYADSVVRIFIEEEDNQLAHRKTSVDMGSGSTYEHSFSNLDFPYLMFDLTKTLESYMELDLVEDF